MAWYTSHVLRYRGRLLEVESRYGGFHGVVRIVKGKPLGLWEGSFDWRKVEKLFYRNKRIKSEIGEMRDFINEMAERH